MKPILQLVVNDFNKLLLPQKKTINEAEITWWVKRDDLNCEGINDG